MTESQQRQRILENWQTVSEEVAQAATQAGRGIDEVKIIGVTKYVDAETTADLVDAGCTMLGENRPQVLWQKAESDALASKPITWHMIGHLQRNKLRRLLRYHPIIHSVDSRRLLDAIGEEATTNGEVVKILLEVNISGDATKTGLDPETLRTILNQDPHRWIQIDGLMAMAGLGTDQQTAGEQFAAVRRLRDDLSKSSGLELNELSMGMSGDFSEAIAEGATMVRIGSRLFEGVM
ncbi:MAG: YggS family pyridoxal phosphate-dependent enzyme [Pirellulaceae bacterium]